MGAVLDERNTFVIPADAETRKFRMAAHAIFDHLWRDSLALYPNIPESPRKKRKAAIYNIRKRARTRAYAWLAEQLALPVNDCHIGMFDLATCRTVVHLCTGISAGTVRDWAKERNL